MAVGQNFPHDSATGHVTGESVFIDDRPMLPGEVWVDYVGSPVAHGELVAIDTTEAAQVPGVVGIFTHADLAHNTWGTIIQDQPYLVENICGHRDEPVVVIAAETREALKQAKKKVHLAFKRLEPIFSIDQAIAQESYISVPRQIKRGDVAQAMATAPHTLEGTFESGGQEHFYLESQASIVYPLEHGQLEVHSSSQHPTEVQHMVAHALGLPYHKVVAVVKRMGGGFGGKESQAGPFAVMAALVSQKLKRPARIVLTKDDDMKTTGKRHPFKTWYKVAFDNQGRVSGLQVHLYSNGGAYADLSTSILERALLHSDGAYYIENAEINGRVCRTHVHPHTAFRGFGGPQGWAVIENIMEEIAIYLKKDAFAVRHLNCYGIAERNTTPYGQVVENNTLPELFEQLAVHSDYQARRQSIQEFNRQSHTHIKGLSMTAVKFGIAFTTRFLNQANALVNVHRDGTVQVSTGATEMGQGVNTKISQIVAEAFGIAPADVMMMPTSTEKNHNTSATAASSGSDINGAAALMACNKIKHRLACVAKAHFAGHPVDEIEAKDETDTSMIQFEAGQVFDSRHPEQTIAFADLAEKTFLNRIGLGDYAFYKTPDLNFNKETGQGKAFNYYTNGTAVTEVLVDRFTGELKVLRADVLMDLGRSINPGIDIGQVTGAFVQGMGWVTTEKLFYDAEGSLLSHSPTTYKIPNVQDIPRIFNVNLIDNPHNHVNVRGSKAVGEPPLLLALSVWTAVKNAISTVNPAQVPHFKLPATPEEILMTLHQLEPKNDGEKVTSQALSPVS